ncbi:hypothetical protein WJX81_006072 [Elliptochloris bilobata]|uniref:Uncharacterized protein n=1 Tax=Elliptochloris bilobata TaxID=381761 RepID=A0AAW1QUL2_9CHLO
MWAALLSVALRDAKDGLVHRVRKGLSTDRTLLAVAGFFVQATNARLRAALASAAPAIVAAALVAGLLAAAAGGTVLLAVQA